MVERCEQLRFTLEPRQSIRIKREGFRENLQRDITTEVGVVGTIHLSHAAPAE
jgi:hypothetical protein